MLLTGVLCLQRVCGDLGCRYMAPCWRIPFWLLLLVNVKGVLAYPCEAGRAAEGDESVGLLSCQAEIASACPDSMGPTCS